VLPSALSSGLCSWLRRAHVVAMDEMFELDADEVVPDVLPDREQSHSKAPSPWSQTHDRRWRDPGATHTRILHVSYVFESSCLRVFAQHMRDWPMRCVQRTRTLTRRSAANVSNPRTKPWCAFDGHVLHHLSGWAVTSLHVAQADARRDLREAGAFVSQPPWPVRLQLAVALQGRAQGCTRF
jgi:hypothetical protein